MNALSPLGMVSELPSSNQMQSDAERTVVESPRAEVQKDYFVEKDGVKFAGMHLLVDLWGASNLCDPDHIDRALRDAAEAAGATILHGHFHHFSPNGGVSGVLVLAESHISIHTWPERDFAAIDIFMCGACNPYRWGSRAEGGVQAAGRQSGRTAARPDRVTARADRSIHRRPGAQALGPSVSGSSAIGACAMATDSWINETLYPDWGQRFLVTRELARVKSEFQDIAIFESPSHGRVMVLDGVIQITEADEFVYQEMLTHVPLLAHGSAENVLIIGAGDGGVLRRVLQHGNVRRAVMVEIDGEVIRLSKDFLPKIAGEAWDDPRAEVIVGDGIDYVKRAPDASFDVIIVDSTDPIGVGEVLVHRRFLSTIAPAS